MFQILKKQIWKQEKVKNRNAEDCSEDDENEHEEDKTKSDEFDIEQKLRETEEETDFLNVVTKPVSQSSLNDWVPGKLVQKNRGSP